MKNRYLLLAALLLLALSALALALGNRVAAQDQQKPTIVPAEFLTPADTPPDTREVAILTLSIVSSEDGSVENVELQRGQIVQSYAPNVLNRPGEWTIEVVGDQKLVYGVQDPRRMDVFGGENETPHETEFQTQITWETNVPLYLFEENLNATMINIYDQDGQLIFSTEVDRVNWTRQ
jgi:hypothetical protein